MYLPEGVMTTVTDELRDLAEPCQGKVSIEIELNYADGTLGDYQVDVRRRKRYKKGQR